MKNFKFQEGFSLMELLIYVAIFTGSAVLLTAILSSTGRIQVRQSAVDELNQQTFFIQSTIQRLVRESSLIENPAGVASTTLKLRMASSTLDPTLIYTDASNTAIYLKQGSGSASALTNDKAKVSSFSITKYENPGGLAVVQVDLTLAYNSTDPRKQFSRDLKIAISRVSAANFDSDLVPSLDNTYSVGGTSYSWKNGYFSGNVGIGTTNPQQKLSIGNFTGTNYISVQSGNNLVAGIKFFENNSSYGFTIEHNGSVPGGSGGLNIIRHSGDATGVSALMINRTTGNVGIGTISPGQKLEINGGMRLNTATSKSTCDSTTRGTFWVTQGGAGVKDNVEVCAKDASSTYAWRTIY